MDGIDLGFMWINSDHYITMTLDHLSPSTIRDFDGTYKQTFTF